MTSAEETGGPLEAVTAERCAAQLLSGEPAVSAEDVAGLPSAPRPGDDGLPPPRLARDLRLDH